MPASSLNAGMTIEVSLASATVVELELAHPVEQVLDQLAVAGDQVGHDPPLQRLEAEDQEQHRHDRRLEVAGELPEPPVVVRVAEAERDAPGQQDAAQQDEDLERLVHRVDPED